jgi:hypothetical protein
MALAFFVVFDGVRIAKRGEPGSPQAVGVLGIELRVTGGPLSKTRFRKDV